MSLAFDDVSYRYPGSGAGVRGVALALEPGELVAVIGASGCGKTTLLKLAAGFLRPDAGAIRLGGADVTATPAKDRGLGVVFQSYALFPHMSAAENIAYPLRLRGVARPERDARVRDALAMVGLEARAEARPAMLSGGQQQRVALARALVFRPRALLLDEPLSALDTARRLEMRDEILRLQKSNGIATLHITHDQEEALSMADRVAVMQDGRLVQVATPRALYETPASRAVATFVGHANLWDGRAEDGAHVVTPVGRLATGPHGLAAGAQVCVLVRPERIRPGAAVANTLSGTVVRDRFLGSLRRYDLSVAGGLVAVETAADPAAVVNVPPEAVQLLPPDPSPSQPRSLS